MSVPLVDLGRLPAELYAAEREAVLRVLSHRQFVLGDEVANFEAGIKATLGGGHAIGVSSGTDALLVALMECGVGPGARVLTSPFSFFATAGVVARLGATPVLLDIEPDTFSLDTNLILQQNPADFAAVIPVHLFGHVIDLDPIVSWAKGSDVTVIEDAAQALGAKDAQGRPGGTVGDVACFSFFPTKNLGAMGDAGLLATRSDARADHLRRLRVHGQSDRYVHVEVGGNFRIDALQAAGLASALPFLGGVTAARRKNALGYLERLQAAGLLDGRLIAPRLTDGHSVHQFVVRIPERRDLVLEGLKKRGIGAAVYYPIPFHLQPCFEYLGHGQGDFPVAELASKEVLALPVFPGLTENEQDEVVRALVELL